MNFFRLIPFLVVFSIGCTDRTETDRRNRLLEAGGDLWSSYFRSTSLTARLASLERIEVYVGDMSRLFGATDRMVLHQRFLVDATRAECFEAEGHHDKALVHARRALEPWILLEPQAQRHLTGANDENVLEAVLARVRPMNEFAAEIVGSTKNGE
jgi:hypothetical protein